MRHVIIAAALSATLSATTAGAQTWYPDIDYSHWWCGWSVDGSIEYVYKQIRTGPSTTTWKLVFDQLKIWSVEINNTQYSTSQLGSEYTLTSEYWGYWKFYGYRTVDGLNHKLYFEYKLYKDGRFQVNTAWRNDGGYTLPPGTPKITFLINYDLNGSADDIVEYVHHDAEGIEYWFAPAWDIEVNYAAEYINQSEAIDNSALFRIVDATDPATQFGAVFWHSNKPITAFMMNAQNDLQTLRPMSSWWYPLQSVDSDPDYSDYAHSGNDQVVYVSVHTSTNPYTLNPMLGKLFQKPDARPVRFHTYIMRDQSGGLSDPPSVSANLTTVVDNQRSASDAFTELTNGRWTHDQKYISVDMTQYPMNAIYGEREITFAQLHEFMFAARNQSPSIYMQANRENLRDWYVEGCIVNCVDPGKGLGGMGVLFDGGAPNPENNGIEREAFAVYWPAIRRAYNDVGNVHTRILMFTYAHEAGHCLSLHHEWGSCGLCYMPTYMPWCGMGVTCTGYESIMTYSFSESDCPGCSFPNNHVGHTTMHFNGSGHHGGEPYNPSQLRFMQMGPEAWIKPGRYGTPSLGPRNTTSPPNFTPY
ncbi:MAG: hypothetical protein GF331_26280 [Chitinivibrionales bacterium]|nr:hypothetical protein [Chitinivibrionales bacterium]